MKKLLFAVIAIAITCTFFSCEDVVKPVTDFTGKVNEDGNSVELKWTQPPRTTAQIFYGLATAEEKDLTEFKGETKPNGTIIGGLTSETEYKFIIYAVNSKGTKSVVTIKTIKLPAMTEEELTLTSFSFLNYNIDCTIDTNAKTIKASIPFFTEWSNLVAVFETNASSVRIGEVIQVSGATENNFSSPVVYSFYNSTNEKVDFTVTLSKNEISYEKKEVASLDIYKKDNKMYAAKLNPPEEMKVMISENNGDSWSEGVAVDPTMYPYFIWGYENYIIVLAENGIFRSEDEGNTWNKISEKFFTYVDRNDDGTLFGIRDTEGLFKSNDNGTTWTQIYTAEANKDFDFLSISSPYIYQFTRFNGTQNYILKSSDLGETWTDISNSEFSDILYIDSNDNGLFVADESGVYFRDHAVEKWEKILSPNQEDDKDKIEGVYADNSTLVILTSKFFHISTDFGITWKIIELEQECSSIYIRKFGSDLFFITYECSYIRLF